MPCRCEGEESRMLMPWLRTAQVQLISNDSLKRKTVRLKVPTLGTEAARSNDPLTMLQGLQSSHFHVQPMEQGIPVRGDKGGQTAR